MVSDAAIWFLGHRKFKNYVTKRHEIDESLNTGLVAVNEFFVGKLRFTPGVSGSRFHKSGARMLFRKPVFQLFKRPVAKCIGIFPKINFTL